MTEARQIRDTGKGGSPQARVEVRILRLLLSFFCVPVEFIRAVAAHKEEYLTQHWSDFPGDSSRQEAPFETASETGEVNLFLWQ